MFAFDFECCVCGLFACLSGTWPHGIGYWAQVTRDSIGYYMYLTSGIWRTAALLLAVRLRCICSEPSIKTQNDCISHFKIHISHDFYLL